MTYLLYNYSLKELTASQVSTFLNLVPVIGVLAAVFLLGEQIQTIQIVGGAVILVGVAGTTRSRALDCVGTGRSYDTVISRRPVAGQRRVSVFCNSPQSLTPR